jgi:hypothetical protein
MTQQIFFKDQIQKKVLSIKICLKVDIYLVQEFKKNKIVNKEDQSLNL